MARCVWALAPHEITDMIGNIQEHNAKAWLATVIKALPHGDLTRVFVTLWALWHARWKAIHEGIYQSPLLTNYFVERFLSNMHLIAPVQTMVRAKDTRGLAWIPSPASMEKVNVDAATQEFSEVGYHSGGPRCR
jgi:hypothetical protein